MASCKPAKSGCLERVFARGVICDVISALNDATRSECLGAASAMRVQRSIAGCLGGDALSLSTAALMQHHGADVTVVHPGKVSLSSAPLEGLDHPRVVQISAEHPIGRGLVAAMIRTADIVVNRLGPDFDPQLNEDIGWTVSGTDWKAFINANDELDPIDPFGASSFTNSKQTL